MSRARFTDAVYQFIRWARVDSGLPFSHSMGVLKDGGGKPLCRRHLNKECTNQFCTESHNPIEIDLDSVHKKGDSFIMYDHLQMAFTEVYGTPFLWKNGIYISKYFECYGELKRCTLRKDPMTWKNETIRTETMENIR